MDNSIKDTVAEQAILGAILLKDSLLDDVELKADDFYHESNKLIFNAIVTLYNAGKTADLVTVQDQLQKIGKLEVVGGLRYLMQLSDRAAVVTSIVKEHARIIKNKAKLRRIYAHAMQAAKMCMGGCDADDAMKTLAEIDVVDDSEKKVQNLHDVIESNTYEIEEKRKGGCSGIPTKIVGLDKMLGGLQKSDLIILAARPAMGKTALALNIATNIAIYKDMGVLVFSLEMSAGQLANRVVASIGGINGNRLRDPQYMDDNDWKGYWEAERTAKGKHFEIYDSGNVSPSVVRKVLRQHKSKGKLDVVIIDYLQLMQADGKYNGNKVLEVAEITRSLKLLAREFNVPIILLSQLNRGVDSRQDKSPVLSDLRDSGSIEQDADIVLFLYREGYYNPDCEAPNVTELKIAKHRAGAVGSINLYFDKETTTFHDMLNEG